MATVPQQDSRATRSKSGRSYSRWPAMAAVLVLLAATSAAAQPRAQQVALANEQGKKLFAAGKLDEAIDIWWEAFMGACGPAELSLAKNLGIAWHKLERPQLTHYFFQYASTVDRLGVSRLEGPEKVRAVLSDLNKSLPEKYGRLEVTVRPAPNATVCFGAGGKVAARCFKTPLVRFVEPGSHTLHITHPTMAEVTRTVTVAAGEKVAVDVALEPAAERSAWLRLPEPVAGGSGGAFHTCVRLASGALNCWGDNRGGQVGAGTCDWYQLSPASRVSVVEDEVLQVESGAGHSCALLQDGTVHCWGRNVNGQLGVVPAGPESPDAYEPVLVRSLGHDVAGVSAGYEHSCALLKSGKVACWGQNYYSQLGRGAAARSEPYVARPGPVKGLDDRAAVELAGGGYHTCARLDDGTVVCWGDNRRGQLGDGTDIERPAPAFVTGLPGAVAQVVAGGRHTCALIKGGEVWCWGDNRHGQLGDGTEVSRLRPVLVPGLSRPARALALGQEHTCVLLEDGTVECWGDNAIGQLGNGTYTRSPTPVRPRGLESKATGLLAGGHHTCAILTDGAIQCWGQNYYGQLGDGTRRDRSQPTSAHQ